MFAIRFAQAADIPLVLTFIRDLADYERMADQVVATEALLQEWLFEKACAQVLLAEEDGEPVGFALFFTNFSTFLGRGGLYLEDLFVRPAWRGRGYGKALLRRLAQICLERGYGRMEWWCLDWNEKAIDVYLSLGAKAMDEWTTYRLSGPALRHLATAEA